MFSQQQQLKRRVFSAKSTQLRDSLSRPATGQKPIFSRRDLISSAYTVHSRLLPTRTGSANAIDKVSIDIDKAKRVIVRDSRCKEELQQQINRLKAKINDLNQQLMEQKIKSQTKMKKQRNYSKILAVQYQNENHWSTATLSPHLLSGIKCTYDLLKQKYDVLKKDYDSLLKRKDLTKQLQYVTYISILEKQNKTLSQKIEKNLNKDSIFMKGSLLNNQIVSQMEIDHSKLIEKMNQLQSKYVMCRQALKDRTNKIELLEKIIIEKDNYLHLSEKENRRINSFSEQVQNQNKKLQLQLKQEKSEKQAMSQKLQYQKKLQKISLEKVDFIMIDLQKRLENKENTIIGLNKQNDKQKQMIQKLQLVIKRSTPNQLQLISHQKQKNTLSIQKKDILYVEQKEITVSEQTARNEIFEGIYINGIRVAQKADIKYHQKSTKNRKVQLKDIKEISILTKLRLINQNIPFSKVRKLFDLDPSSSRKGQWQKQYITMRQVKQILTFPPFSLPSASAHLLARYLIEDVQAQYVYCDEFNENSREIVKSILKTLVGEYPVCSENSSLDNQVRTFMQNYQKNLKSALEKFQPTGFISYQKFLKSLNTLGMNCSQEVSLVLMAKMQKNALGIQQLDYSLLFK